MGILMEVICPMPDAWHQIHVALTRAWRATGEREDAPPNPLILAGWAYSNDVEKRARWQATVAWAAERGLGELVSLSADAMLIVAKPSSEGVGPMGGPMHLSWNFAARPRLAAEVIAAAFARLEDRWGAVAGASVAPLTKPSRFTGSKRRRLLVDLLADGPAPWGGWDALGPGVQRREFTAFRESVNACIYPHEVDHVDFLQLEQQR